MDRLSFVAFAALLAILTSLIACTPAQAPDAAQQESDRALAGNSAPLPAETTAAPSPSLTDEEVDVLMKGMVAGKSYHLDLRFRGKLHLWRVRFDGQQVIGSDGHPTVVFGTEGPAVFGDPGTGPLTIFPLTESGWRWKQSGDSVELWKDDMRYRGTLSDNTIAGDYVEGDDAGTFVMTAAD